MLFYFKAMCDISIFFIFIPTRRLALIPYPINYIYIYFFCLSAYTFNFNIKKNSYWNLLNTYIYPHVINFNTISKPMRIRIFHWDEILSLLFYIFQLVYRIFVFFLGALTTLLADTM